MEEGGKIQSDGLSQGMVHSNFVGHRSCGLPGSRVATCMNKKGEGGPERAKVTGSISRQKKGDVRETRGHVVESEWVLRANRRPKQGIRSDYDPS